METLSGVATFQLAAGGVLTTSASVLAAETVENATIPVNDDLAAGRATGYAVANPSSTDTVSIKVVTVKGDGTPGATLSPITLAPGQQKAQFFWEDGASSQKFAGSAVLMGQNGKKFAVVALAQDQNIQSAVPVIPGKAPGVY